MATTKVQDGHTISYTATADVNSGDGVCVGSNTLGVAPADIAAGATGILEITGVYALTKATTSGNSFDQEEDVYVDDVEGVTCYNNTTKPSGAVLGGRAAAAATVAATTVNVRLNNNASCHHTVRA